jgi:hypothetical protein
MSFLNTGFTPTVSARLTKAGRNAIAKGDFLISYFSIGDSEYNYNLSGLTSQRVFAPLDKNTHVKYPFLYSATGSTIYGIPVESPDDENQQCRNIITANSGWTLNTVWENKPLGVSDTIALKDYQSNVYSGVKSYLGYTSSTGQTFVNYSGGTITGTTIRNTMLEEVEILPEEQNSIAILHYSESGTTVDPYKFFKYDDYISNYSGTPIYDITKNPSNKKDVDFFEVTIPNLMYHRLSDNSTGTVFHMSTGKTKSVTSEYNSDFQLDYVDLLDVNEYSVGKIFFNQKIIVFDDQEIVAVLDTGSTRNYTLTAPKVSSYITNDNPITGLTTGQTLWVTYVLSGGTVSGDLPCSYFMKVTGTTNDENVTVKFNSGGFKHLNSGYNATQIHILYQFTDNGEQPLPNDWNSINFTGELSSITDLQNGHTFTINQSKITLSGTTQYTSSLTNFGKERTYTEGTVSTVIGTDVQVMNFVINLPAGKFETSQNPTKYNPDGTEKSGYKYITEVALLNSNKETMVTGKFSAPTKRDAIQVFNVKLDF